MSTAQATHAAAPRIAKPAPVIRLFCPFPSALNPAAAEVQAGSLRWAARVGLVADDDGARRLALAKIAWLPARVFHSAQPEALQVAADWTTLFCMLDDRIDVMASTASLMATSEYLSRLLEAFHRGAVVRGEPIENGFVDLKRRMSALASCEWVARFAASLESLFAGYVWESINYWRHIKPTIDAYCSMREITIGLSPLFLLGELAEHIRMPESARANPAIRRLEIGASRCVGWANDIFTYEKELQSGEVHNLVLLLADSTSFAQSVQRVVELHDAQVRSFIDDEATLPLFGDLDEGNRRYVAMLRSWIRGHLDWAQDNGRYRPPL